MSAHGDSKHIGNWYVQGVPRIYGCSESIEGVSKYILNWDIQGVLIKTCRCRKLPTHNHGQSHWLISLVLFACPLINQCTSFLYGRVFTWPQSILLNFENFTQFVEQILCDICQDPVYYSTETYSDHTKYIGVPFLILVILFNVKYCWCWIWFVIHYLFVI